MKWVREALCARPEYSGLDWFPRPEWNQYIRAKELDRVREVCARCPVQVQCLNFAVDNEVSAGVWAGRSFGKGS